MVRKYFGKVLTVQSVKKLLNKFHIISFYSCILDQHLYLEVELKIGVFFKHSAEQHLSLCWCSPR